MGVMTLVATQGSTLAVEVNGSDGEECLDALDALAQQKFGESE